jgi:excisionase family DNA binding protein
MSSQLAAALLDALDDDALDLLADRLAPRLERRIGRPADEWMTTQEAAAYLRIGVSTLHRLARAGTAPAYQDGGPGGKYVFSKAELRAWRGR